MPGLIEVGGDVSAAATALPPSKRGMETAEFQSCVACGVERRTIHREWMPEGYEIQSLECPRCRTVMRMVRKRPSIGRRVDKWKRSCPTP